jgi:hypothetical protein
MPGYSFHDEAFSEYPEQQLWSNCRLGQAEFQAALSFIMPDTPQHEKLGPTNPPTEAEGNSVSGVDFSQEGVALKESFNFEGLTSKIM